MAETLSLLETISYFWDLTFTTEVLWVIIPLILATIVIVTYFERYDKEKAGWNTYLSNSLVLLFVSILLFKYIYSIKGLGFFNFIEYFDKTIAAAALLLFGLILLKFNFEHILPERFAKYLSSVLTINIGAYAVVLFVYSKFPPYWNELFALLIILIIFSIILNIAKLPLHKLFGFVKKEKKKEEVKNIKESKYQIKEIKGELKSREKSLKKTKVKELDERKDQAIKLKKIIRK
tara:strand:- start:576 stop:1277 length:702 start_codon:yes stop_codon:yes gene_type:complete